MVKIRYRELSPGVHAQVETVGRHTVVYLLPGLDARQRRAALRRMRHNARMGLGPRLPAVGLGVACVVDRVRTAVQTCAAVIRAHPAGSTVPAVALGGLVALYALTGSVSVHLLRPPAAASRPGSGGRAPVVAPSSGTGGGRTGGEPAPTDPAAGSPGGAVAEGGTAGVESGTSPSGAATLPVGTSPARSGTADAAATTTSKGSSSSTSATQTAAGAGSTGSSSGAGAAAPGSGSTTSSSGTTSGDGGAASSGTPAPASGASGSTPSSGTGLCLDVGPLGVCLTLKL